MKFIYESVERRTRKRSASSKAISILMLLQSARDEDLTLISPRLTSACAIAVFLLRSYQCATVSLLAAAITGTNFVEEERRLLWPPHIRNVGVYVHVSFYRDDGFGLAGHGPGKKRFRHLAAWFFVGGEREPKFRVFVDAADGQLVLPVRPGRIPHAIRIGQAIFAPAANSRERADATLSQTNSSCLSWVRSRWTPDTNPRRAPRNFLAPPREHRKAEPRDRATVT